MPYLVPGESAPVEVWTPDEGLRVAGILRFSPQPGTTSADLDLGNLASIVDVFDNEALYADATKLLKDDLVGFATGLLTGGGAENCPPAPFIAAAASRTPAGSQDAFMAVDQKARKLYFAQQSDADEPNARPALGNGPPMCATPCKRRSAGSNSGVSMRKLISTGSPFERTAGYSRAVVQGDAFLHKLFGSFSGADIAGDDINIRIVSFLSPGGYL